MTKRIVFALMFLCMAFTGIPVSVAADPPSIDELARIASDRPLGPDSETMVRSYVKHWLDQLQSASQFDAALTAQKKLVAGFDVQESVLYQVSYAKIAAEEIPAALEWKDTSKQILVAMALASMPRFSAQPGLEKLAASPSPAIRYWAVRGYARSAKRMMEQVGVYADTMLATLEKLGLGEKSGSIAGAVLRALRPYNLISSSQLAKLRASQQKVWQARCADVRDGEREAIDAYRTEVGLLAPSGPADTKAVLQMLADLMEAASRSLDSKEHLDDEVLVASVAEILISVEERLTAILNRQETPVRNALRDRRAPREERITKAQLAVESVWKAALKEAGIEPKLPPPTSTTTPATTPAGG
jgi:hypothetical protein